jgi:hypothetical protein
LTKTPKLGVLGKTREMGILSKMTISGVFCGFELFWRKIGKIFIKNEIF